MKEKVLDLLLFLFIYLLSYTIGYFFSYQISSLFMKIFVFDIISTVSIWIFSLIISNSSLYDAYWSLTPFVMLAYVINSVSNLNIYHYIFILCFCIWSWRLTINWIITFENRRWEDWRYKMYRANNSKPIWHIINFFGIQMMPTLLVFVSFLPIIILLSSEATILSIFGCILIIIGTLLEFFADHSMHKFLHNTQEKKVCENGLWYYSRHPNYLGEILIWIGVFLSNLLVNGFQWYTLGFLSMIVLFEFISIPLMENRQVKRRIDYFDYQKSTSRLLILPKKKWND